MQKYCFLHVKRSWIRKKGILDEEKRWTYIEALVTYIQDDEDGNFVINLRDITLRVEFEKERTRLEKELNHAKKMETIGTLAGGIAHDFKNILMPIIGYANMITYDLKKLKDLLVYYWKINYWTRE